MRMGVDHRRGGDACIVHTGNAGAHEQRRGEPFAQPGGAKGEPESGGGGDEGNDDRREHPPRIVLDRHAGHVHALHADIVHRNDPGADDNAA